jgi:CBS domain-containing protein
MRRLVHDIVRDQEPLVLPPTATVREACCRMQERKVGAVVVAETDGLPLGIFTGRDAVSRVIAQGQDAATATLARVMTAKPVSMPPQATTIEALRLMRDGGFRHLVVVEDGRVVGVVSRRDFLGDEQQRLDEEAVGLERV